MNEGISPYDRYLGELYQQMAMAGLDITNCAVMEAPLGKIKDDIEVIAEMNRFLEMDVNSLEFQQAAEDSGMDAPMFMEFCRLQLQCMQDPCRQEPRIPLRAFRTAERLYCERAYKDDCIIEHFHLRSKRLTAQRNALAVLSACCIFCIGYLIFSGMDRIPAATATPNPIATVQASTKPPSTAAPMTLPQNGAILKQSAYEDEAGPLTVVTSGDKNYYVKLKERYTGKLALSFFVRAGMEATVDVPIGSYELSYAYGGDWYGVHNLFGEDTVCAKADDIFTFEIDGDYVTGWTVELFKQANGNLDTTTISVTDF